MQRTRVLILLMLLILGLVLLRESRMGFATPFERRFADWLARNAELQLRDSSLALIELNGATLPDSRSWPLPPLDFALFLQAGLVFEPSLLAIEPVLAWPQQTGAGSADVNLLHEQMLRCPKLLLGAKLGFPNDPELLPPLQKVPSLRHVSGNASKLLEFPIVEQQALDELRLTAQTGFTNLPNESPVRRVPLVFRYCGQVVPSLVLQSATLWLKLTPEDIQVELGSSINMGGQLQIPIDDAGMMSVNWNSRFTRLGLEDLLLVVTQIESGVKPLLAPELLKNKVLLLARSDSAARILDSPSGISASSGELFAHAIATIQNGAFPQRAPWWGDLLIVAGVIAFSSFLFRMSNPGAVFSAVMALPVYLMCAITLYGGTLVWVPIVLPAGLLAFALLFRLVAAPRPQEPPSSDLWLRPPTSD